jgi:hypothetical protein
MDWGMPSRRRYLMENAMATKLVQLNLVIPAKAVAGLSDGTGTQLMVELDLSTKPLGAYSIQEIEDLARAKLKQIAATA